MKLPSIFLCLLTISIFLACRKKPKACIEALPSIVTVGDTITVSSCSQNATTYLWRVDGEFINVFNDPFFGNHFSPDGGNGCDSWIDLSFYNPGTYQITLINPLLTKGVCSSSSKEYSRKAETSVTLTVTN